MAPQRAAGRADYPARHARDDVVHAADLPPQDLHGALRVPELPVPVKPRYRGFHRFDLTTCIGCDKCARACPVDCIYIEKEKAKPPLKGFKVTGFKIDYTKCMFCALCVDPCPVDCIFMGSSHDQSCYSRDGCIVDYAKLPLAVAWGQDTLNPTAVHESKKVSLPVWTKA